MGSMDVKTSVFQYSCQVLSLSLEIDLLPLFACFTSQVLFLFKGPSSLESRHYILPLVRSASLCTSSILYVSKSSGEGRSGLSRVSTVSTFLAAETMVPQVVIFLRVFRGGFSVSWSCSRNLCYCCLI